MAARRWTWILAGADGTPILGLTGARSRKITWRLEGQAEATFDLAGDDPAAPRTLPLRCDVLAYRDGVLAYRGRVMPLAEKADADQAAASVSTVDYRGVIGLGRTVWPGSTAAWSGVDAGVIPWDLIADTQALPGGDLGIIRGIGATQGVTRTHTLEVGKNIGEAIDELAALDGGFDWEISPFLVLNLYHPSRGSARSIVLRYGTQAAALDRSWDLGDYANAVVATSGSTNSTAVAPGISTAPEGRWETAVDGSQSASLSGLAVGELGRRTLVDPAWSNVDLVEPLDPGELWLGDTLRCIARVGHLDVDAVKRVTEITCQIDEADVESWSLTLDRRPRPLIRRIRDTEAQIRNLSRR